VQRTQRGLRIRQPRLVVEELQEEYHLKQRKVLEGRLQNQLAVLQHGTSRCNSSAAPMVKRQAYCFKPPWKGYNTLTARCLASACLRLWPHEEHACS